MARSQARRAKCRSTISRCTLVVHMKDTGSTYTGARAYAFAVSDRLTREPLVTLPHLGNAQKCSDSLDRWQRCGRWSQTSWGDMQKPPNSVNVRRFLTSIYNKQSGYSCEYPLLCHDTVWLNKPRQMMLVCCRTMKLVVNWVKSAQLLRRNWQNQRELSNNNQIESFNWTFSSDDHFDWSL